MLAQRLISAAVGIPIIIALILIGDIPYTAAVAVILALASLEFIAATEPEPRGAATPSRLRTERPLLQPSLTGTIAATGAVLIVIGADNGFDEWSGAFVLAVAAAFVLLLPAGDPKAGFPAWTNIVAALAYIGVLGSYLIFLRDLDDDGHWVLLAVLATWGTDTFAFAVGRAFGTRRIFPAISPGKTLEGTLAALAGGFATVVVLNWPLDLPVSTGESLLLGVLLPVVAVIGDLAESFIKRGAGIKDTGDLVPGHGGFLDRLDSLLFTVPVVYFFAIWVVL